MSSKSTARSNRANRPSFRCAECGWAASKWVGRCGECQAWGTVEEVGVPTVRTTVAAPVSQPARPIAEVDAESASSEPTGVEELDRVLGGGLVPGAVVLFAGEPGVGKSTLLLDVASEVASRGRQVLYVTGEESAAQVRLRAERIGALRPRLYLAAETDLATLLGQVDQVEPDLLIVDSVQTVSSAQVDGAAGNVSQVREVAGALIRVAKERNISTLLVGHVTKDGSIAGPRVLEHLVDVVCQFEGDRHSRLRMVRAVKNRYGPTDEVGCFELSDVGIKGLPDPSGLFLSRSEEPTPGTCVTVTLEGRRPLVVEVQGLLVPMGNSSPRRATSGLDSSRVAMILAVLNSRLQLRTSSKDAFVATVGGVRLSEPASDLAVALALASAGMDAPLPARMTAFGEVSLSGEVRPVTGVTRRLQEAARLGFTSALVPAGTVDTTPAPDGLKVVEVRHVHEAVMRTIVIPRPA
ncbi:MAG TPA: DNA repair protein RadA [Actinomycetales bacterium]|nr:DNA repair protein RadA [Actinomycetales bacterium]